MKIEMNFWMLVIVWIVLMFVGFWVEHKYDTILFYIFGICYFIAAMHTRLVRSIL